MEAAVGAEMAAAVGEDAVEWVAVGEVAMAEEKEGETAAVEEAVVKAAGDTLACVP